MDFVGGSDGSREQELLKGSSSPSHRRLLQLGGVNDGWGGNCSISPQIYDHQRRERDRGVDFDFRRSNHQDQVVTAEIGESDGGGERDRAVTEEEREHMFDKVVTPSDVGKLNRLVIPKQHAERYFPLDSTNNDKGLLLNFEDRSGKSWRFRYSYWNSSQSYVMTKGWSRFVKDKKLDAGDIVSFHRSSSSRDRLFIDWRRRHPSSAAAPPNHHFSWSPLLMRPPPPLQAHYYSQQQQSHHHNYNHHHHNYLMSNYHPYRYGYGSVVAGSERPKYPYSNAMITTNTSSHEDEEEFRNLQPPEGRTSAASGKKLMRLFGVNMECSGGDDEVDDGDVSGTPQQHHLQLRLYNGNNDNKGKAISISNSNSNPNPNPMSLDLDLDM